jgi:HlyD family secretion protein
MKIKTILLLMVVAVVAGGAAFYTKFIGTEPSVNYRTAEVKRGDLVITVNATGTLEPEEVVDVGAQIVGPVLKLGPDPRGISDSAQRPKTIAYDPAFKDKHIDYGSPVEEGTLLAVIDPAVYQAQDDQAKANLQRSQADLGELVAKRDQALADWNRAQQLKNIKLPTLSPTGDKLDANAAEPIKAISDSDYDLAKSNYEVAKANVDVGQATIVQSQDALNLADTNLSYTKIISPVKGTIVARRVDVGQTVVATFSAQSLFLIAKDLSQLQIWASVNEADIGRIHLGMPVSFQVEAFPDENFQGTVSQIRLNAQSNQNVVTYTVVIDTDNSNLKLLPYLTTDPVKFEVEKHTGVLLVPNAALRWQPKPDEIAPDAREALKPADSSAKDNAKSAKENQNDKGEAPSTDEKPQSANAENFAATQTAQANQPKSSAKGEGKQRRAKYREEHGVLWVKEGNFVRPLEVRKGDSDDQDTEVSGDGLQEGMEVVMGEVHADEQTADETNPFAPRFFRGNRGGQKGGQKSSEGKGAK